MSLLPRRFRPLPAFFFLCSIHLFAAPAPDPPAADAPDFGPALDLFSSFGLESLDPSGQYSSFSLFSQSENFQPVSRYFRSPFSNKAWVSPASGDLPARFLFFGGFGGACRRVSDPDPASNSAAVCLADWNAADSSLSNDVSELLLALRGSGEPGSDALPSSSFDEISPDVVSQPEIAGALLLVAVHLRQAGFAPEANQIADLLFRAAGDRASVVRAAADHLAFGLYFAATARLSAARDWSAYRDDLQSILDRFGFSWSMAPALELLLSKVDARRSSPFPSFDGVDPEFVRGIAEISGPDASLVGQLGMNLLVNPAIQLELASPDNSPALRFFSRGIHAIPDLVAMSGSDFLVPPGNAESFLPTRFSHSSRNNAPIQSPDALLDSLNPKPASLGSLCADFLSLLVPRPESRSFASGDDLQDLLDAANAFYENHSADSPFRLAAACIAQGSPSQSDAVSHSLLLSRNSNVVAFAESIPLFTNVWSDQSYSLLNHRSKSFLLAYASAHPERAAAVLPPIVASIRDQLPARLVVLDPGRRERESKSIAQFLDSLSNAPGANPDAADSDSSAQDLAASRLARQVENLPPRDAVGVYLQGIVSKDDPTLRRSLLDSFLLLWRYQWHQESPGDPAGANAFARGRRLIERFDDDLFSDPLYASKVAAAARSNPPPPAASNSPANHAVSPLIPLDYRDLWRDLLGDSRPIPPSPARHPMSGNPSPARSSVADGAAFVLASILLDVRGNSPKRLEDSLLLGDRLLPFWRSVARAALDGLPAADWPPFPSPDDLPPPALSNLVDQLLAKAGSDPAAILRNLEPGALLALARAEESSPELRQALAPRANRVVATHAGDVPDAPALLQPFADSVLSPESFDSLLALAFSMAARSNSVAVSFERNPWLDGAAVSIRSNSAAASQFFPSPPRGAPPRVFVFFNMGDRFRHLAEWNAVPPSTSPAATNEPSASPLPENLDDLSPEALADMAIAMHGAQRSSRVDSEAQSLLRKAVQEVSSGQRSSLAALSISFTVVLPQAGDALPAVDFEWSM